MNSSGSGWRCTSCATRALPNCTRKPGGLLLLSFSDRWFPTKAIAVWSRLHEFERLGLALHLLRDAGFAELHTETRRGLPRPADDKYLAQRAFADPLFAAWGYAPA